MRQTWLGLLLATILAALSATSADALTPVFISGRVYSAFSGKIIPSATIRTSSGTVIETATGQFQLRVPPTIYDLIVSAEGYCPNVLTVLPPLPGGTLVVSVFLRPMSTAPGLLTGEVRDIVSSKPISTAYISSDLGSIAVADSSGAYRLTSPSGAAQITVFATGYAPLTTGPVPIPAGGTITRTFMLQPLAAGRLSLSATVSDNCSQTPVADAVVMTSGSGFDASDDAGSVTVTIADNATTAILTAAQGYFYRVHTIDAAAAADPARQRLAIYPADKEIGLITGTVIDRRSRRPVADARIHTDTGAISFSAQDGTYQLFTNTCATQLSVSAARYASVTVDIAPRPGALVSTDVALTPLGAIVVRATSAYDNSSIEHASVTIQELPRHPAREIEPGTYRFTLVPDGSYTISATHPCYDNATTLVEVTMGDTAVAPLNLEPPGITRVTGTIIDIVYRTPVANALVRTTYGSSTRSARDGSYQLDAPACDADLSADATRYLAHTRYDVPLSGSDIAELDFYLIPCPADFALHTLLLFPARIDATLSPLRRLRSSLLQTSWRCALLYVRLLAHADQLNRLLLRDPVLRLRTAELLQAVARAADTPATASDILHDDAVRLPALRLIAQARTQRISPPLDCLLHDIALLLTTGSP